MRGLNAKGAAEKFSRKNLDELAEQVRQLKGKVLAWVKVEADKLGSVDREVPDAGGAAGVARAASRPGRAT